jgi:hypothetical protein
LEKNTDQRKQDKKQAYHDAYTGRSKHYKPGLQMHHHSGEWHTIQCVIAFNYTANQQRSPKYQ